ncbi:unnamed protein product [Larinioides sclopetarius]|uniref:Uncharacterized protein n=1 Tax=Larinioides sclopetarius TaxID=280406 RepID=A0AAV1ZTL3_9ARAC
MTPAPFVNKLVSLKQSIFYILSFRICFQIKKKKKKLDHFQI